MVVATCLAVHVIWSVVRRLRWSATPRAPCSTTPTGTSCRAGDYFATDIDKSPFLHFWSLVDRGAVLRRLPGPAAPAAAGSARRAHARGLAGLLVASLAAQLYWAQVDTNHAYYGTDARLYQLLAGALLAVALHTWRRRRLRGRRARLVALVGLAGLLVLGSGLVDIAPSMRGIGATAVSVLLIGGLMLGPGQPLPAAARCRSRSSWARSPTAPTCGTGR